jgi:hypothetical protein
MKEQTVREHLQKGWIQAIVTFEVVGKPKEHIEKALTEFIENIRRDERIKFIREEREEAIEHEDGMFSTFCEAELLAQDLETFTWLCINFSPASIEILEPTELQIEAREITNWLNDLLATIHEIGTSTRALKNINDHMTVAMNQLIRNTILLSLKTGPKTEEELVEDTGITGVQLGEFLKAMAQSGKVRQQGDTYTL